MRFDKGDKVRIKENWFTIDNCKELIGKIKVIDRVIDNSGLFYYLKDTETIIFEVTDLELVTFDNLRISDKVLTYFNDKVYKVVDIQLLDLAENVIYYRLSNELNEMWVLNTPIYLKKVLPHE